MARAHCMLDTKAYRHTHSQYVIPFSLQQFLHELAWLLRYTYIACFVFKFVRIRGSIRKAEWARSATEYSEGTEKIENFCVHLPPPPPPNFSCVFASVGSPDCKGCDFFSEGYGLTSRRLLFFLLNHSIFIVLIIILLYYILLLICRKNLRKTNCKVLSTIRDGTRGQANPRLYDEVFVKNEGETKFNLKLITPKYTPLCQPCDFYFYKQIENVMKHLQIVFSFYMKDKQFHHVNML